MASNAPPGSAASAPSKSGYLQFGSRKIGREVVVTQHENADRLMLILKALDPGASVKFSEYTGKWYVEASIEIGNGCMLTGGAEHRETPNEAVRAYFQRLTAIDFGEYVVTRYHGHRREWRWNGAAFAEVTRDEALARG